jgi:type II secretory pathway pseudopilin PulG
VSLIELVFAIALVTIMTAMTVPGMLAGLDEYRASAAARYVAAYMARARMEAIARSANVGIRFESAGARYTYAMYLDGNGDGIRTRDVDSGADPALRPAEELPDRFPGVEFGTEQGLPPVDAATAPPGDDPIHLGVSSIVTFTPSGTASSGSVYIRSAGAVQFVVRVFGETGRTRVLKFDPVTGRWSQR